MTSDGPRDAGGPAEADQIAAWVTFACDRNGVPDLAARIDVTFNPRFTRRMGDAAWRAATGRGRVRLSGPLWPRASLAERRETVIHETCHVIAGFKFGRVAPHGRQWRAAMAACDLAATRCHTIDRTGLVRRQRRFVLADCPRPAPEPPCSIGLPVRRRVAQGRTYRCRLCRMAIDRGTAFAEVPPGE